ncbi:PP2C family serine/threonine-protein phosphatase [Mangrovibacillus sp. Mu-81]|jgi:phosphoserine phosphatase RsbX|uniref:PP2C family serine/threonine-protein phosphatase n=1 Tax=Mangrovibacillus sp. Mu-81 TaxID=3121478 RepID=UPI002FE4B93C
MGYFQQNEIELYAEQVSKNGNPYCGDSYYYASTNDYFVCVLADGLGSGKYAYESSHEVVEIVEQNHHEDVGILMDLCNNALQKKRGAAVAIIKAYYHSKEFVYSCVGNIRFYMYSPEGKITYPLPVTGFLSGRPQKYQTKRYSYEANSRFLLHSDGLNISGVKAVLQKYPTLHSTMHDIQSLVDGTADDTTYIVGSLL